MTVNSLNLNPAAGITPRNGMYTDENGFMRFINPGTAKTADGKRWYCGTIVRKIVDGHGDVQRKSKQQAEVFCLESQVQGLLFKQCPDPFAGTTIEGELRVSLSYGERQ